MDSPLSIKYCLQVPTTMLGEIKKKASDLLYSFPNMIKDVIELTLLFWVLVSHDYATYACIYLRICIMLYISQLPWVICEHVLWGLFKHLERKMRINKCSSYVHWISKLVPSTFVKKWLVPHYLFLRKAQKNMNI